MPTTQPITISIYRYSDKRLWPATESDTWNLETLLGSLWCDVTLPEITSSIRARAKRLGLSIRIVNPFARRHSFAQLEREEQALARDWTQADQEDMELADAVYTLQHGTSEEIAAHPRLTCIG